MNGSIIKWFRWALVVPASIGLGILYAMHVNPFLMQGMSKGFEHGSSPLIASMIAIISAYTIAPMHKFKASIAVGGIWLLAPLAGIIIVAFGVKVKGEEQYLVDGGIALSTTITGLILGVIITWKLHGGWQFLCGKDDHGR